MNIQLQQQITPELSLYAYNDIPVLQLHHRVGTAKIALQGAHLFSWQPAHSKQDGLWLSDIEPFNAGTAIRGHGLIMPARRRTVSPVPACGN